MKLFPVIFFLLHGCCRAVAGINVMNYGARADGRSDDTKAFMEAWKAACGSSGAVKLVIPRGTYLVGPLLFNGPCKDVLSLRIELQGTMKATTELNRYKNTAWVQFGWVNGLSLMGGVFDGQGAASWPYNNCPKQMDCKVLPTNIMFVNTVDTYVEGITSLNSKFFHVGIVACANFRGIDIAIGAPADSPNTDGIHMERSRNVTISRAAIGTGDDCVSVGQGNSDVVLTGIRCGPGHGSASGA
ncbi:hypothetical protein HPP92_003832 [Vanilla planifolia]|uniref:Polygalacturonase n=1 Tax=Vanilla planifolia TaxID=51239 RepID=A0A835S367_VANPL|nr:hypothetical protein HPP92_003832 [Vanilla planifolia]